MRGVHLKLGLCAALLASTALATLPAAAQDASWVGNGTPTGSWNTAANWTPTTVPLDTAFFNVSPTTTVTFSAATTIDTIQFNTGALAYTFNLSGQSLEITAAAFGPGIVNNSGVAQTFNTVGLLQFSNGATAADATINNTPGATTFTGNSTAATATITNSGGGVTTFTDFTNAGSATITTNAGSLTQFLVEGTAGNARLITNAGGTVDFSGTAGPGSTNQISAGSIEGAGTYNLGANQFTVGLNNLSTLVSGTINDGGTSGGAGASLLKDGTGTLTLTGTNTYSGSTTLFLGSIVLGGAGTLGAPTAALNVSGGQLDLGGTSQTTGAMVMTGGQIVNGTLNSASYGVTDGTISANLAGGGALTKDGGGTVFLSGTNSYAGGTTITAGALEVTNSSAIGTGGLTFDGGTFRAGANGLNFTNAITVNATGGTVDTNGQTMTLSGMMSDGVGVGTFNKIGAGTLTLTADNSAFTGGVTINGGTISVGHNNALGTGTFTVLGSTLDIQNGITIANATDLQANLDINVNALATGTHAGNIGETGGAFGINKVGDGTLVLSGNNTYTGATNVMAGTLTAASSTAFATQSAFTVNGGATLAVNDGGVFAAVGSLAGAGAVVIGGGGSLLSVGFNDSSTTFSGDITGNGSLEYVGAGTLNLTGNSTIGGDLTVCTCAAGVLAINGGTFNVGGLTSVFSGTLAAINGATLTSTDQTLVGAIGPGFLQILGGSVVNSQGGAAIDALFGTPAVTVSGAGSSWNVTGGLAIGNAGFGGVANLTVADGGAVTVTGATTIGAGSTLNLGIGGLAGTINAPAITNDGQIVANFTDATTLAAAIDGAGSIAKSGPGTLVLTGNNAFTGGVTINGGTISVGHDNALGTGTFTVLGSTLDIQNGINIGNTTDLHANLDVNVNALATGTHSGDIGETGGAFGLTKVGAGTLVLSGNNTYTGATNVTAGTLRAASNTAFATQSAFTVNGGATLEVAAGGVAAGIGSLAGAGAVAIGGGSLLSVGFNGNSTTFAGSFSGAGSLEYVGAGTLNLTGNASAIGGNLSVCACATGVLAVDGGSFNVGGFTSVLGGALTLVNGAVVNSTGAATIGAGSTLNLGTGGLAGAIVTPAITNDGQIVANFTDSATLAAAIAGTGSIAKSGPGTLILTGDSSFTGGVTINGGTISVGHDHALGAGTFTVLGSTLDIQANITISNPTDLQANLTINVDPPRGTHAGTIGETGGAFGLVKTGGGVLILSGANTYSGGTTVNNGAVLITADANLGSAAGGLTLDGGRLDTRGSFGVARAVTLEARGGTINPETGTTLTISGPIGGPGSLTFFQTNYNSPPSPPGPAVVVLSGTNTYAGGTNINAPIVAVSSNANLGDPSGALAFNGGTLRYLDSFNTARPIALNVIYTQNATVDTNGHSAAWTGPISGPGNLFKEGLGTLTLLSDASYGGGTVIANGTLQLGNGGTTGSLIGDVLNNGTLAVNRSNLLVLDGVISGTGAFQQNGTGITALTAANTYTGATTVNAGGLLVTGSIASSSGLTVNPGAFVGGTGALPNTVINGGALSPGLSIGTITAGGLTFVGPGNYIVEVSPTQADRTNVTGSANLGGTLTLLPTGGQYTPGRQYVLLHADGGRAGTFATGDISNLFGNAVTASVTYDDNNVFLNFAANTLAQFLPDNAPLNVRNVANALDQAFVAGNVPPAFLSLFNLTGPALVAGLTQLTGEVATGAAPAGFRSMDQFLNLMLDPFLENRAGGSAGGIGGPALAFASQDDDALSYSKRVTKAPVAPPPSFEQRWNVWGAAYGGQGSFDGDAVIGSHDLDVRTGGVAGGADYRFSPNTVAGFALTGNSLSWRLDGGLGSGKGDAVQAGFYGSTKLDKAYVSAALSLGWYDLETDRIVLSPGAIDRLHADFSARSVGGRIEGGYRVPVATSSGVTPYAAFQALSFRTPSYTETNPVAPAAFALTYAGETVNDVRSELGLRLDSRFALTDTSMLILRGRAAWAHGFDTDRSVNAVFQALPVAGFTVFGASGAEDAALVSAGGELRLANGFSLLAKFDGEFAGGTQVYAGSGTLRYSW